MSDLIDRQKCIEDILAWCVNLNDPKMLVKDDVVGMIKVMPSAEPEIIRCKDCKWWRQQTNYQGSPLSFGFCESDDMWRSLYGETYEVSHITTDDDFYCGYADMRYVRVVI